MSNIKVVHVGRAGYVEIDGYRYEIEMFAGGHFSIGFPSKNRHKKLQDHLEQLTRFAAEQNPEWSVENRSRNYRV